MEILYQHAEAFARHSIGFWIREGGAVLAGSQNGRFVKATGIWSGWILGCVEVFATEYFRPEHVLCVSELQDLNEAELSKRQTWEPAIFRLSSQPRVKKKVAG